MNKDQRLLQEAYNKVHSLDLLPEEELFIQKICEDILNNLYDKIPTSLIIPQREDLSHFLLSSPIFNHLHILKYPESIKRQVQHFYSDVQASVSRHTYVQSYRDSNRGVLREKFFSFYSPQPLSTIQFDIEMVEFNDKQKALEELKKAYRAHFKRELSYAGRDVDDWTKDLLAWRDRRFKDIETTKELSKDFDVSALEDFS